MRNTVKAFVSFCFVLLSMVAFVLCFTLYEGNTFFANFPLFVLQFLILLAVWLHFLQYLPKKPRDRS